MERICRLFRQRGSVRRSFMGKDNSPIRKFDKMCHFGNKYIAVDMPHERDTGKVVFIKRAGIYYVVGGSYDLEMCLFFAELIDHINDLQRGTSGKKK